MFPISRSFPKIVSLFLVLLIFLASPTAYSEEDQGVLRVICHVALPWVIGNQTVEPLIGVDDDNVYIPCLATSYTWKDNSMELQLREGVVFQDGAPFNASSVITNWQAYQRTARPYFTIDLRLGVEDIKALSPYRLKIVFRKDGPLGLSLVLLRSFYIYSPSYFKHSGGVYPPGNQANITEPGPWGTGPYILKELKGAEETAILEANPHYWQKGRPEIRHIEMYGAKQFDSTAAHRLMKAGKADLFDAVNPSMYDILAQSPSIYLVTKRPLSCLTTLFNMRKPDSPLRDIRIRKALNLLIDRHTLFKYLGHGMARMTAFIFPLSSENGLQPYPYDPEEAKMLLKSAGYTETHKIPIVIGYFASEKKIAYAIASMLQEGNVTVQFQEYRTRYEWYRHVMDYGHDAEHPMESETWDLNIVNTGLYTNSVATHFGESFVSRGGYRWILPDPKVDAMFFRAMRHRNLEKAEESLKDLEKYLYDQYYMMPIYISPTIIAVNKRIAGSPLSASGYLLNLKEVEFDDSHR